MNVSNSTFLQESDPSKTELINPGEYLESPSSVNENINSPACSVGSVEPRGGDFDIVLRTTITGGDDKREMKICPKGIKSFKEVDGHLILTATTTTGEFVELKVDHTAFTCIIPLN